MARGYLVMALPRLGRDSPGGRCSPDPGRGHAPGPEVQPGPGGRGPGRGDRRSRSGPGPGPVPAHRQLQRDLQLLRQPHPGLHEQAEPAGLHRPGLPPQQPEQPQCLRQLSHRPGDAPAPVPGGRGHSGLPASPPGPGDGRRLRPECPAAVAVPGDPGLFRVAAGPGEPGGGAAGPPYRRGPPENRPNPLSGRHGGALRRLVRPGAPGQGHPGGDDRGQPGADCPERPGHGGGPAGGGRAAPGPGPQGPGPAAAPAG